jgi:hypothetical protein
MVETLQNITSVVWLVLAVVVIVKTKQWNKRFSDLHKELTEKIRGDDND